MRTLSVKKPMGSIARNSRAPVQVADSSCVRSRPSLAATTMRRLIEFAQVLLRGAAGIIGELHSSPAVPGAVWLLELPRSSNPRGSGRINLAAHDQSATSAAD